MNKTELEIVFWEINRDTNIHYHKQFLPVEESLLNKFSKSLDMRVKLNNEKFKRIRTCTLQNLLIWQILSLQKYWILPII